MFWHDMGWGGMWFGWFFWIVLIVLIIWAIVRFSNQKSNGSSNLTHRETPLDILKRRYASGEITKQQYDEMRRDLQ